MDVHPLQPEHFADAQPCRRSDEADDAHLVRQLQYERPALLRFQRLRHAEKRILYLRFQSGDIYRDFNFPNHDYRQFLSAESKGRYFLSNIRNCFRYEPLAKLRVA